MRHDLDAVIVGAGQAGLAASYRLQRERREHLVLERGRIGETWLSQRWDSFRLNTPNFMNTLPGLPYEGPEPGGFWRRDDLVRHFEGYATRFGLPVRTGVEVVSVERVDGEGRFLVRTRTAGGDEESLTSRAVVVASGVQRTPKVPPIRSRVPAGIQQVHTSGYRSPGALPPGAVVVVGSGQSGCQVAEELLAAGRRVYLCTSRVGRAPRRHRGRDLMEWWTDMKVLEVTLESLEDRSVSRAPQPQISGLGPRGHTISLQHLARQGMTILGRLEGADDGALVLGDDAAANVRFADGFSQKLKRDIDAYLGAAGIDPPPLEEDPADVPDPDAACVSPLRRLDLREAGVGAIVWATGFAPDFPWLHLPVLDPEGRPAHHRGVSSVRGLYFVGFPWLVSRGSGIIRGVGEDARSIAAAIAGRPE